MIKYSLSLSDKKKKSFNFISCMRERQALISALSVLLQENKRLIRNVVGQVFSLLICIFLEEGGRHLSD